MAPAKASPRTQDENDPVKEAREDAKQLENSIKEAEEPDLTTGRVISSEERRLMSMVDEKKLPKEDKEALLLDSRIIRMVSFETTYAVQADSDEAAIEAVKRDASKFPFSEPTVTVQSRAATAMGQFLTGEEYEKRQTERNKREAERAEREAKETAEARKASAKGEE